MGEIRHEGGRLNDGLKWSSREDRSPLTSAYFRKGIRRKLGKGDFLMEGGKERPSSLNLAPTTAESRDALRVEDYGKKSRIPICKNENDLSQRVK